MGEFKYTPIHEVDARHRAARAKTSPRGSDTGEQKNVQAVLSLGATRYFSYRKYLLAVPPIPFKLGQQVLALYIRSLADAKQVVKTGGEDATASYYQQLRLLTDLMWKHVQPLTKSRRFLKRIGLLRNVLKDASEKEVTDIATFFLQGRMMSTVQSMEMEQLEPSTPMSSMNSKSS
jgi:hypothetical protein